jgi:hypothetical protein
MFASPHAAEACLTTPHMTLGLNPLDAIRPALLMGRNTAPAVNASFCRPGANGFSNPVGDWNRSDMTAFSD